MTAVEVAAAAAAVVEWCWYGDTIAELAGKRNDCLAFTQTKQDTLYVTNSWYLWCNFLPLFFLFHFALYSTGFSIQQPPAIVSPFFRAYTSVFFSLPPLNLFVSSANVSYQCFAKIHTHTHTQIHSLKPWYWMIYIVACSKKSLCSCMVKCFCLNCHRIHRHDRLKPPRRHEIGEPNEEMFIER